MHTREDKGDEAGGPITRDITVIAHHQAPIIIHPPEAAFDLPALAVAGAGADWSPPFGARAGTAGDRWDRRLHPPAPQIATEGLTVICLIRDQFLRACPRAAAWLRDPDDLQGGFRYTEPLFIGRAPQPLHITLPDGGEALQGLDDAERHPAILAPQIAPDTAGQHDRPTHKPNSRLTPSRG
jgi:hypothetical protein